MKDEKDHVKMFTRSECETDEILDLYPPLPDLGAPVVSFDCETTSADERVRLMKPSPPTREIYEYDDDGAYVVGEHTDAEMVELQAAYEEALSKWYKTNGIAITKGPIAMRATVTLETGERVEPLGDGKSWRISRRSTFEASRK